MEDKLEIKDLSRSTGLKIAEGRVQNREYRAQKINYKVSYGLWAICFGLIADS
jgi:hypothetical protein